MLLVCPRCSGSLPPDARACPRCGLILSSVSSVEPADDATESRPANGREPLSLFGQDPFRQDAEPPMQTQSVGYVPPQYEPATGGTAPYQPAEPLSPSYSLPVRPRASEPYVSAPVVYDTGPAGAGAGSLLVPKGAIEILPNESVVFQLGALYLTNKRVILLAPSVLRTAFLRDIDAVGTLTERASGFSFFVGLLMLAIAGALGYVFVARSQLAPGNDLLSKTEPLYIIIAAIGLAIFAIYLLVNYFFWVKRTLFLSVGGRPLMTVSITDWNSRKLVGMDSFINAYSQVKDAAMSGEE